MAQKRPISTNFWKDNYIAELDPIEKLLFNYLLTNPKTNIAGIYEINLREIAFDTGIDKDMVLKILGRFEIDGKIQYQQGWLLMRNWVKHQSTSPHVQEGIERVVKNLPAKLREILQRDDDNGNFLFVEQIKNTQSTQSIDTLSIESDILNLTLPNLTLLNSTLPNLTEPDAAKATTGKNRNIIKVDTRQIDEMFGYWHDQVGFELKGNTKANRHACSQLIKTHGIDDLKRLIDGVALAISDKYAPNISDFCSLKKKQNDLVVWGRKRTSNRGVVEI